MASQVEKKIKQTALKNPPNPEESVDIPNALPACPCLANGCPSRRVAAFAGVPGVFRRIAEIEPP